MKGNGAKKRVGKFISIPILAIRWNSSNSTVRRIIEEGGLKGVKVRRTFKVDMDSVLDYEKANAF